MEAISRQFRLALRTLLRTPSFTLAVVLTLGLGIGAASVVLSTTYAVQLKALQFPNSERLVHLAQVGERETRIAPVRLREWRERSEAFAALTGYYAERVADTTGAIPEQIQRATVTEDFLKVWGVAPQIGTAQALQGQHSGDDSAVLISDSYWQKQFARDPDVLERSVRIADRSFSIVGVMPADFAFPQTDVQIWWPMRPDPADANDRDLQWYTGVARLKPNVSLEAARAEVSAIQRELGETYPESDRDLSVSATALKERLVGDSSGTLWILLAAVGLLLLIACTNIAALLVSRVAERDHQAAIRQALGASPRAIAGQIVAETILIGMAGAAVGLLVAKLGISAVKMLAADLPRVAELHFGAASIALTLALAASVALICALVPTWRSARGSRSGLRGGSRALVSGRQRLQWGLVGVQVTLTVTLLVTAGLLLRGFDSLSRVQPGFDSDGVLALRMSGNWKEEADRGALLARIERSRQALTALPQVESAATAWKLPGTPAQFGVEFIADGAGSADQPLFAEWRSVAPEYFNLLQIPMLAGDTCALASNNDDPQLMVNRRFAEQHYAGRSPLGQRLSWEGGGERGRIVGVVGNARESGLQHAAAPTVYSCNPAPTPFPWFLVRVQGDPSTATAAIRERIAQIEPLRAVYAVEDLSAHIDDAYAPDRLRSILLGGFAAAALLLSCLGVYATLNYVIGLRRREIGLRLALGATSQRTIGLFVAQALRVGGVAGLIGLAASAAFGSTLSAWLYGISAWDPLTYAAVVLCVIVMLCIGAFVPALQAARIAPISALRSD